tara:strand:+ start:192 stop:563 length:372 start_codon:yes stop_codon:yes gene_type:complete
MSKQKNSFKTHKIYNSKHLESIVKSNVEGKQNSYYLITNTWDKVCRYFNDNLPVDGSTELHVVDIFNVPNALEVIKTSIKSHRETISTSCLSRYDQLPMLVVIHKSFPRVVSYNGSVGAEIGV